MTKLLIVIAIFLTLTIQTPVVLASEIRGASIFKAVNEERLSHGRMPLTPSKALVDAAQAKADHMARLHYFAHSYGNISLRTFLKKQSYRYRVAGENLAKSYDSTESLMDAWLLSPTHRANILDPDFKETGIGIARDGNNLLIVQYFGTRR